MSALRTVALSLLAVGVVGLFFPDFPGADVIRWGVVLTVIAFISDSFNERKVS